MPSDESIHQSKCLQMFFAWKASCWSCHNSQFITKVQLVGRKEKQERELRGVLHKDHQTGCGKRMVKSPLTHWRSLLQHHQDSHLWLPLLSQHPSIHQKPLIRHPSTSISLRLPQPAATHNTTAKWGHCNHHRLSLLSGIQMWIGRHESVF